MQRRFRRWSATAWMDRSVMRLHCPMLSVCKSSKEWARRIRPSSETWQALIESCLRLESPWATYPRAWSSILSQKETSREVMRDPPSARYAFMKTWLRQLSCQLDKNGFLTIPASEMLSQDRKFSSRKEGILARYLSPLSLIDTQNDRLMDLSWVKPIDTCFNASSESFWQSFWKRN